MIVWIASYPRSGNRLCRTMLREVFGLRWVGSAASEEALRRNLADLLDELGIGPDDEPLAPLREFSEPVYLKTHSLPEHVYRLPTWPLPPPGEESSPALYIVRDARDALVSFARYSVENSGRKRFQGMGFEEAVADLMRRPLPYGGWSGNVAAWSRRPNTVVLRFEDLIGDPVGVIASGFESLGLDLPEPVAEPPSFEELRSRSRRPELLRRGEAAGGDEFPAELAEDFWQLHGEQMAAAGYEDRQCPECGRWSLFGEPGRLECGDCYAVFA